MNEKILIVPFIGDVKVSNDTNTVTVDYDRAKWGDKLKGYRLMGKANEWMMESEGVPLTDPNVWNWETCIFGRIDTEFESEEEVAVLCFFLRKAGVSFMILADGGKGRYLFMRCLDAKINLSPFSQTVVFSGDAPYPTTYFDGEVEEVGRAVDLAEKCIEEGLRQTRWENIIGRNVNHGVIATEPDPKADIKAKRLADCELSVRTINICAANDIDTLGDLCKLHKTDWLKFRNSGKKSLAELDDLLHDNDLDWAEWR